MEMFILSYAKVLYIYSKLCLQVSSTFWLKTYLTNQYVILRYRSSNLCKWNYLYGDLLFFKIQVNHFMAQDEPFGGKMHLMGEGPAGILSFKTFLSFINRLLVEKSAVATGLEDVSFHSNPKERHCQRMLKLLHSCTHLTH